MASNPDKNQSEHTQDDVTFYLQQQGRPSSINRQSSQSLKPAQKITRVRGMLTGGAHQVPHQQFSPLFARF